MPWRPNFSGFNFIPSHTLLTLSTPVCFSVSKKYPADVLPLYCLFVQWTHFIVWQTKPVIKARGFFSVYVLTQRFNEEVFWNIKRFTSVLLKAVYRHWQCFDLFPGFLFSSYLQLQQSFLHRLQCWASYWLRKSFNVNGEQLPLATHICSSVKGTVHPKIHIFHLICSAINPSRLFRCQLKSFGDTSCRNIVSLKYN